MSADGLDPGTQAVVVFVALATFALVTTAVVVAVGVGPVAEAVPDSSSMPGQPGEVVGGGEQAPSAIVAGTVTGPDGEPASDATVVLASHPAPVFAKATPSELASIVDGRTDSDLTVVETTADGSFSVEVPADEYDVIALRHGNVSEVQTVNATTDANASFALREDRALTYETSGSHVEPGENATVTVAVYNRDDDPASFSVSYRSAPTGWRIVDYRGDAVRVNESTRTFHFENVPSGSWARAELVVRAPENATPGESVTFGASAAGPEPSGGDEVVVNWRGTASLSVPAEGPPESTTHLPGTTGSGDDLRSSASPSTTDGAAATETRPPLPGDTVPGFGLAIVLACTTLVIAVFAARQQA